MSAFLSISALMQPVYFSNLTAYQIHAPADQDEDSCICHDAQSQRSEIVPEVWIGIHQNYWMWQRIRQSHFANILSVLRIRWIVADNVVVTFDIFTFLILVKMSIC